MIFDTHCHILPQLDDGAADLEQAIALLKQEKEQGVETLVCTPHFYPQVDDSHLRDASVARAFDSLQTAARDLSVEILLGHEIHYYPGMPYSSSLLQYCYQNTHTLLLELPFQSEITRDMLRDVESLGEQVGYEVVLAHIERYVLDPHYKQLVGLVKDGVVKAQIAPGLFTSRKERKAIEKLLKQNLVSYLGSDAHHPTKRPVQIGPEWARLQQEYPLAAKRIEEESLDLYERMTGKSHVDQSNTLYTF